MVYRFRYCGFICFLIASSLASKLSLETWRFRVCLTLFLCRGNTYSYLLSYSRHCMFITFDTFTATNCIGIFSSTLVRNSGHTHLSALNQHKNHKLKSTSASTKTYTATPSHLSIPHPNNDQNGALRYRRPLPPHPLDSLPNLQTKPHNAHPQLPATQTKHKRRLPLRHHAQNPHNPPLLHHRLPAPRTKRKTNRLRINLHNPRLRPRRAPGRPPRRDRSNPHRRSNGHAADPQSRTGPLPRRRQRPGRRGIARDGSGEFHGVFERAVCEAGEDARGGAGFGVV